MRLKQAWQVSGRVSGADVSFIVVAFTEDEARATALRELCETALASHDRVEVELLELDELGAVRG